MTGELIKQLECLLRSLHSDYHFEYDEAGAMNVKADAVKNNAGLIFIEEIRRGRYRIPQTRTQGFFRQKETQLSIYFCRFSKELEPFAGLGTTQPSIDAQHTLTQTRQAIRDRIESEVVVPFIDAMEKAMKTSLRGFSVGDYNYTYPYRSRFDSNEVAVVLDFTLLQQSACAGTLK